MEACIKYNQHSIIDTSVSPILSLEELIADQNKYNHIYIGDLLNFIDTSEIVTTLTQLKHKLEKNGILTIEEYDQYNICDNLVHGRISSTDFNNIIMPRKYIFTIPDIFNILNQISMKIMEKDIDSNKHLIKAINE